MRTREPQRGWTLVEIMITLTVIGLLSSAAGPSFLGLFQSTLRDAMGGEALSALHLTRSEAIKRNDQFVLCKSSRPDACSSEGDWAQGWLAFHDLNGNAQLDEGEEVVLRREGFPPGWRMSGNGPVSNHVAYQSLGQTRRLSGGFQAGTITLCKVSSQPTTAVRLVINSMGRPRTETVQVASC